MNGSSLFEYKFKGRLLPLMVVWLMCLLCLFLAAVGFYQGGGLGVVTFCIGAALLFFFVGCVFFIGRANIVIDDESISRTIFGRRFEVIQWRDVERIAVFPVRGAGVNRNIIGYNIITYRSRSSSSNKKRIYFTNQGGDLSVLIGRMNECINRFNIRVERTLDETTTIIKSIPE